MSPVSHPIYQQPMFDSQDTKSHQNMTGVIESVENGNKSMEKPEPKNPSGGLNYVW